MIQQQTFEAMRVETLDRMFVALADAGRRGMIEQLSLGPATVKELAKPANMRLPSAVKHLRILEDGGLVMSRKVGRTRTFSMRRGAFSAINDWVSRREIALNAAFDRLVQAMNETLEEDDQP